MMTTAGSGAVFFLGSRAHYQVLQPPEARFDAENGNTSTETIYQNAGAREMWNEQMSNTNMDETENYNEKADWSYCDNDNNAADDKDRNQLGNGVKRRSRRRPSETALCERDVDMKPAILNKVDEHSTPKSKSSRRRIFKFLSSLTRRKRRLDCDQVQYLQHLESVLTTCTYRETCRCLECQSRYFEYEDSDCYESDGSECSTHYAHAPTQQPLREPEEDDDVFTHTVPGDNISTDRLIETSEKMSISSDDAAEAEEAEDNLNFEVAAGTPVLLNYLLTHPITCAIQ